MLGSGDVRCPEDALRMLSETGCSAVMIGRAARGNPWIFAQCNELWHHGRCTPPDVRQRFALAEEHISLCERYFGSAKAHLRMKKHLAWYIAGLPNSAAVRSALNMSKDLEEMRRILRRYKDDLQKSGTVRV